jgi:hypothetical protein
MGSDSEDSHNELRETWVPGPTFSGEPESKSIDSQRHQEPVFQQQHKLKVPLEFRDRNRILRL